MMRSMQFGKRNIRSSGRGSGSVEITLPINLAMLEAVPCSIELRDGLIPEIVLRTDLFFLLPVFETAWQCLASGVEQVGDVGSFSESDYVIGLFAERGFADRPCLAYADALPAWRHRNSGETAARPADPEVLESCARIFEAMATVAGTRLGLSPATAALLGNQIAYAATGAPVPSLDVFTRNALADVSGDIGWCRGQPLAEDRWCAARPVLERLFFRVADCDSEDSDLTTTREHWYRARRLEARLRTR